MANDKKWRGIRQNECVFQGEVVGDPTESGDFVFLNLETKCTQKDKNGQFTELSQVVPLMAEPGGITQVIKKYVQAGRKLLVRCQYKSWISDGATYHAFAIEKMELGDKPYVPKDTDGSVPY